MKKLIIAEKPSVGMTIAKAVKAFDKYDGYMENDRYIVSWCIGHLITNSNPEAYDEAYKKWSLETLPIIPKTWKTEPIPESRKQLGILKELIERSDVKSLVEATDAGREGELIFRLVYDYLGCKKPFERLWVSSLEIASIQEGLSRLKPSSEYDRLYSAALARSRADWIYGMNGTRYYTLVSGESGVKSVGRVQTPTLAMIVQRDREIENFKVQNRWAIVKDFGTWKLETDKFNEEPQADKCLSETDGKEVVIDSVEKAKKKANPPLLHSLTSLQQEANRRFGYTANDTLQTMQGLYEKKILSYPRTDSNYITSDMEDAMTRIVGNLSGMFGSKVPGYRPGPVKRLVNNAKVGDHYAVIVTETFSKHPDASKLSEKERMIVRLVETRILESVASPFEYEETKVTGTCSGYEFRGTGRTVISEGWRSVAGTLLEGARKQDSGNVFPADIAKGKRYMAGKTEKAKRDTAPPSHYTEETLLGAMERAGAKEMDEDVERKGLGTSSTRAQTIETLLKRGYIKREKKFLISTPSGQHLIDVVDEGFKSVDTTVGWENRLLDMERGKGETTDAFCGSVEKEIVRLLANPAVTENNLSGQDVGSCPICGGQVKTEGNHATCGGCGRRLYRTSKLFLHNLDDDALRTLLNGDEIQSEMHSETTGKNYKVNVRISREKTESDPKYFALERVRKEPVSVGTCPVCGGNIVTGESFAKCDGCGRRLFRTSSFYKHNLTDEQFKALFSGGKVPSKVYSKKNKKTYSGKVLVSKEKSAESEKYFALEFVFPKK